MDWATASLIGTAVGSLVSGIGVFIGGAWAIIVHFRSKREEKIAAFRKHLADAQQQFSQLAASFENQIISTLEKVFRRDNRESARLIEIADVAIGKGNAEAAEAYLKEVEHEIREHLMYCMSAKAHGLAATVRSQYTTAISPLILFSPVLHRFFRDAGELVLTPYENEFSVKSLHRYFMRTVVVVCELKNDGKIEVETKDDVRLHLRACMAQHMAIFRGGISLQRVIKETLDVVNVVAAEYTDISHRKQWRHHKKDRRAPLSRLSAGTRSGTMRAIIDWKFKRQAKVLLRCRKEIDELEQIIEGGDDDTAPSEEPCVQDRRVAAGAPAAAATASVGE